MENKYLKWLSGETDSIVWHDSAVWAEQQEAFANGACGMTTNPFLVNGTLRGDRAFWQPQLDELDKGLAGDAKVSTLVQMVTGFYATETRPIFDRGEAGRGYVCAQVNPTRCGDADYMLAQAELISGWAPNIVIKLPATAAGLRVYEECAARGWNVAATVSFTVPQVLEAARAATRGQHRAQAAGVRPGLAIAVLMVGRLDDYLRDVALDQNSPATEEDIIQAGTACMKRAYSLCQEEGHQVFLMPAGCRGGYHVKALSGADMIFSVAPKIAAQLAEEEGPFDPAIAQAVPQGTIDRLLSMREFRKAYEPNGMAAEDFITFGSANRTLTQFTDNGWNALAAYPL